MIIRTLLIAILTLAAPAAAQQVHGVTFAKGDDAVTLEGSITGGEYADYKIAAKSGQNLKIDILGTSIVFFNVMPPDDEVAIHNSSYDFEMSNTIKLPKDGNYVVRVYLQGENESNDHTVRYMIKLAIPQQ